MQRNFNDDNDNSNNETSNNRYENDLNNIFQHQVFFNHRYSQSDQRHSATSSSNDRHYDRHTGRVLNFHFLIFMFDLIVFIFFETSTRSLFGQIYSVLQSVEKLLGSALIRSTS
jgi:hypothetical protein